MVNYAWLLSFLFLCCTRLNAMTDVGAGTGLTAAVTLDQSPPTEVRSDRLAGLPTMLAGTGVIPTPIRTEASATPRFLDSNIIAETFSRSEFKQKVREAGAHIAQQTVRKWLYEPSGMTLWYQKLCCCFGTPVADRRFEAAETLEDLDALFGSEAQEHIGCVLERSGLAHGLGQLLRLTSHEKKKKRTFFCTITKRCSD